MNDSQIQTISQAQQIIQGLGEISFQGQSKGEIYQWVENTIIKLHYLKSNKKDKGTIRAYLCKISGYSRAQMNRLILRYKETGKVKVIEYEKHSFSCLYKPEDIKLLAQTDELHLYPHAGALKKTLVRQYEVFGKEEYKQIKNISIAHIYNIRRSKTYQQITHWYSKTKAVRGKDIGVKKKPQPLGKPGYLRVDSVHQGDSEDGKKGVYHIHMVDEVTQFDCIVTVSALSHHGVEGAIEHMIIVFPFIIRGFHSDNGTEYVNEDVAQALLQLLVDFTRSRSGKCTDNGLVEGKNGSIIRKWITYEFIGTQHVDAVNTFLQIFMEYLNYHRICAFPSWEDDPKKPGKQKKVYKYEDHMTAYDKLKSLPNAKQYLRKGISFTRLNATAHRTSDNGMAQLVQNAFEELLQIIRSPSL